MLKLLVDPMLSNFEWLHEVEVLLLCIAYWIVSGQILEFDEFTLKIMCTVKMVNNKVVENLIIFPESPGSLYLD